MKNINPLTGIRYGVISLRSIDPDVAELLMFGPDAIDQDFERLCREVEDEAQREVEIIQDGAEIAATETDPNMSEHEREDFVERRVELTLAQLGFKGIDDLVGYRIDQFVESYMSDEPHIVGRYDDIEYQITWLGGAPLLWILDGPIGFARCLCSPCVPEAADLDSGFCSGDEGVRDDSWHQSYVVPKNWMPVTQEAKAA